MRDYQRELQALREKIACCQEDRNVLNALLEQERVCREEMERCRAVRDKEQRDVDRLEGVSLAGLLASLRGDRNERMDRERAEAYAAAVRYEAAKRQLNEVQADMEFRRRRIAENRFAREEYDRLLEEKAAELGGQDSAAAVRLRQIGQRLTELTDRRRELQEAVFCRRDGGSQAALSPGKAGQRRRMEHLRSVGRRIADGHGQVLPPG